MPPNADILLNRFTLKAKFRHMQVLVKLAELGSMRRAAEAVHMTQPAISQQVSELERLLETELFFRHAKGVTPTEAAKDLLPVARRILSALQDGSEALASRLMAQTGVVRVAASPAAIGGLLHGTLASFAKSRPDIQVNIVDTGGADPLTALTGDQADLICTRETDVLPSGWSFVPCIEDKLVVVCGAAHPLAHQTDPDPAELGAYKWLQNRTGSIARAHFERLYADHDWPHSTRCQVITHVPELTKELLETGEYIAILPRSVTRPWVSQGTIHVIAAPLSLPLHPLGYIWRAGQSGEATTRFANHLFQQSQRA